MARFVRYSVLALLALAGPTWLGQVGVAEAGFRATQFGYEDSFSPGAGATTGADSPTPESPSQNPTPRRRAIPQLSDLPAQQGTTSSGSASASAAAGMTGILSSDSVPPIPVVTRLRAARERVSVISPPRSVFEPPRDA